MTDKILEEEAFSSGKKTLGKRTPHQPSADLLEKTNWDKCVEENKRIIFNGMRMMCEENKVPTDKIYFFQEISLAPIRALDIQHSWEQKEVIQKATEKVFDDFQKRFENNEAMEKMLKEDVSRLKSSSHFKNEEIKRLNKRLEEVATICCKWNAKEIEPLEALHKIWKLDNFCMEKWKELYIERKQLRQKFVKGEKSEV